PKRQIFLNHTRGMAKMTPLTTPGKNWKREHRKRLVALRHLLHFPKKWVSAFKSNLEPIDFVVMTSQALAQRQIAKIIGRNACRRVASCELARSFDGMRYRHE